MKRFPIFVFPLVLIVFVIVVVNQLIGPTPKRVPCDGLEVSGAIGLYPAPMGGVVVRFDNGSAWALVNGWMDVSDVPYHGEVTNSVTVHFPHGEATVWITPEGKVQIRWTEDYAVGRADSYLLCPQ